MALDDKDVGDEDDNDSGDKANMGSSCRIRGWRKVVEWQSHGRAGGAVVGGESASGKRI